MNKLNFAQLKSCSLKHWQLMESVTEKVPVHPLPEDRETIPTFKQSLSQQSPRHIRHGLQLQPDPEPQGHLGEEGPGSLHIVQGLESSKQQPFASTTQRINATAFCKH